MYLRATTTYGSLIPGSEYIRSLVRQGTISAEAAKKLRWMDHYARLRNARLSCRYFGISPKTFYRWKRRFDPYDLTTLEEESRRPRHVRQPQTPLEVVERILELRTRYPRWGKKKLVVLLGREGIKVSASTVGRVMNRLKARGVLVEPLNVTQAKLARRRRRKPRYAIRKPKDYRIEAPGDLVEVDTVQIKLLPNETRYQFSARDVVCRFDAIRAYKHQSSLKAAHFLSRPSRSMADQSSRTSSRWNAKPRRSLSSSFRPSLPNSMGTWRGRIEPTGRSSMRFTTSTWTLRSITRQLAEWEHTYNRIRPHESLDYLTPYQYYRQWKRNSRRKVLPM